MNDNTVGKTVKQVKKFISAAFDEDQHTNLTFQKRSFRVISAEVDETYLSELEIEKFDKADISSRPELLESKKRFVFDCWVGLRNSDLTRLGPNNLVRMLWGPALKVTTQKTGEDVVIPFHPTAKAIWDSWGGIPPKKTQKYSQDIKDIAELAGMKEKIQRRNTLKGQVIIEWLPKFKMITPHTGRRSFATNCYLMGQPTKTIMAVTGHKSEKEFMKYIRLSKEQHASIMNGFFNPKEENNLMKKEA
jgi:integrase